MVRKSTIFNDTFWNCLVGIEENESDMSVEEFCSTHDCENHVVLEAVEFLSDLGLKVDLYEKDGVVHIKPLNEAPSININFKLTEWLALQAHFPLFDKYRDKAFHKSLVEKLSIEESLNPRFDLFSDKFTTIEMCSLSEGDKDLVERLKGLKESGQSCGITCRGKKYNLIVHRTVYLDGGLKLIGEDVVDKCLVVYELDEISDVQIIDEDRYQSQYSSLEVSDFIEAFRAVSGNEVRAILKIKDGMDIPMNIEHHFLGNPYITSNVDGDVIWAVGIEMCPALFEWMFSLDDRLEILDPVELKERYSSYKEEKLREKGKKAA